VDSELPTALGQPCGLPTCPPTLLLLDLKEEKKSEKAEDEPQSILSLDDAGRRRRPQTERRSTPVTREPQPLLAGPPLGLYLFSPSLRPRRLPVTLSPSYYAGLEWLPNGRGMLASGGVRRLDLVNAQCVKGQ